MPDILTFYRSVRSRSEDICAPLKIEDYVPQPAEFVSPPKWHLAHTTWFFEEFILKNHLKSYELFHPDFGFLFNSYYNNVGDRTLRNNRGNMTRPTVEEIYDYRQYVDQNIEILLAEEGDNRDIIDLVTLGLNHEQQHQELLITDLKFTLSLNPLCPVYKEGFSMVSSEDRRAGFLAITAGNYEIGAEGGDKSFIYDNERKLHKIYLNDYEISQALVSNGEYLEFIEADGYEKFEYWHDEGFSWVNEHKIKAPLYWRKLEGKWFQYSLGGLVELNPNDSLAHINFYEASAYASWKGLRLPTEAEWEVAADQLAWGSRWEWTQSAYLPYPGFSIAEGAIGEYNGKFMVNQKVLRGASKATAANHSRKTYRNFFHPHLRWQLTGIRLAR